jgi:hypothetical protein
VREQDYLDWLENQRRSFIELRDLIFGLLALAAAVVSAYGQSGGER